MNKVTHLQMISADKRNSLFTLLGALGSALGMLAGCALWKVSNLSLDVEIYRPDGEYIQVSPPGTVAQLHGLPGPWTLLLLAVAIGAISGLVIAWVLSRTGWRLVRTPTVTTPLHDESPSGSSSDE
ncbi:hypothetical protein [Nocardia brasiliensis]|uniref:hypothetical protein n=1 Tax=Nocardia brasiliensis TaxID=37326 RepID=UPI00366E5D6E